jgi:hypothetical protein
MDLSSMVNNVTQGIAGERISTGRTQTMWQMRHSDSLWRLYKDSAPLKITINFK